MKRLVGLVCCGPHALNLQDGQGSARLADRLHLLASGGGSARYLITSGCGSYLVVGWIRPVLVARCSMLQVLQDQKLSQSDCLLDARCGRQAAILLVTSHGKSPVLEASACH
jgi:hypothetical protein